MNKLRKLFKDITDDSPETMSAVYKKVYKLDSFNTCATKNHKTNNYNPWCLHGLGQEKWINESSDVVIIADDEEDHFTIRPKYLGRYSGLRNLGATCYVNSLVQILFYNEQFRETLYQYTPQSDETGCVIRCLQQLLVNLQFSDRGVVDTTSLVTALQLPFTQQQDVIEFRELLFGMLTNSMPNIQDSCKGTGSYVMRCLTCSNVTTRTSEFTDLKLQVQIKNESLVERIQQLSAVEVLEGENSYHCSQCNELRRVERCFMINKYPQTLHLQLLRFSYDTASMVRKKDTSFVKFDDELILFNITGDEGHTVRKYRLSGIILHVGDSTTSGHYIAIVRREGRWVTFNDDVVSESDSLNLKDYDLGSKRGPGLKRGEYYSRSVYMLIYETESSSGAVVRNVCLANLIDPKSSNSPEPGVLESKAKQDEMKEGMKQEGILKEEARLKVPEEEPVLKTEFMDVLKSEDDEPPPPIKSEPESELTVKPEHIPPMETEAESKPTIKLEPCEPYESPMKPKPDPTKNILLPPEDIPSSSSSSQPSENSRSSGPPPDLLEQTLVENREFAELRSLVQEQKWHLRSGHESKVLRMRDACLRLSAENKTDFAPIPTSMLKSWLRSGECQRMSPSGRVLTSGNASNSGESGMVSDQVLCSHNRLSYHKIKKMKYINADIIQMVVGGIDHVTENGTGGTEKRTSGTVDEKIRHPFDKLVLCDFCVEQDLQSYLYEIHLDEDRKTINLLQNADADSGWWAIKDDLKSFKKLVLEGREFNKNVLCRHGQLDPQAKRRKLLPSDTKPILEKYFKEFPTPSHSTPQCETCINESEAEELYFSSLFLLKKDILRLITSSFFSFIPNLTPYIVPLTFIKNDLQPLYKRRLQERISLDNSVLVCKHDRLTSDALEHAAFVKESEWEVLCSHFGPTIALRCDTIDTAPEGDHKTGVTYKPPVIYTPEVCQEGCVMLHDDYVDQAIYLREERSEGKRGRRGDKILHVSSCDTIHDVKVKICRKMAIAPSEQTLSTLTGKILEQGTLLEQGVLPGSILYLDYNQALLQETEIFDRVEEQGFKGTALSGHL